MRTGNCDTAEAFCTPIAADNASPAAGNTIMAPSPSVLITVPPFPFERTPRPLQQMYGVQRRVGSRGQEGRRPSRAPETRSHVDDFEMCTSCDKVYWRGAHHPELSRIVAAARRANRDVELPVRDGPPLPFASALPCPMSRRRSLSSCVV